MASSLQPAIEAERLRLFNRQVVRVPVGVLFAAGFIAYMMSPHVGTAAAWSWAGVAVAIWAVRTALSGALLARPPQDAGAWMRRLTAAATVSGIAAGSASIVFFDAPAFEWAMMTMVLCAWSAAGIAISVAVPTAFYGLASSFLVPLAMAWAVSDRPFRLAVAGLILFFLFYLIAFARDGSQLLERALRVGYENEELARQLRAREAEAQAARARAEEASLAKSRFLAAASHDLRQPLHSLSLLLDHALHSAADPKVGATLQQAARSADSLGRLFTGLLDLTRLDAGSVTPDVRPVSLEALLRRLDSDFRTLALDKGLAFERAATEAWVRSDPAMLERLLRNLLDNAVKYTEAGHIALQVSQAGPSVRVAVHDTGIGIDAADRERIFEEYYQVRNPARDRRQGIGLGLAIVRRMAEMLGHPVEVDSTPGQGSTFSLTLERCAPPREDDDNDATSLSFEDLRNRVVVVIDDDVEVCEAMETLLRGWGCRPVIAAGSAQAIAQLDAATLAPDAILADWRLGGPENGLEVIRCLAERFGMRPAAIVTGEINPAELALPSHCAVEVMQKPVRARVLGEWLLRSRG